MDHHHPDHVHQSEAVKMTADQLHMRRAMELARKAIGCTTPNPVVGAVIVKNGAVLGEGYHTKAGAPHAEIEAIRSAGEADLAGATLYVTLEPCSSWGRTPPCTDAILKHGFARVVIGCTDPNPRHAGAGMELLRSHGIEVTTGVEEVECRRLNEAFFKWITTGKPFVLLKLAMTLDGRIATETGNSQWITGPAARQRVQELRQWADAVMVGAGTYRTDSPRLTVRDENGNDVKVPLRFVASRSKLDCAPGWEQAVLNNSGDWNAFLDDLGKRPALALLLEGGGKLAASALNAGVVDKIEFHYAPKILGGTRSRPTVGGYSPATLAEAFRIEEMEITKTGTDFSITGYVRKPEERGHGTCLPD